MITSDLVVMTLAIGTILLVIQRTERRMWWLAVLVMLPISYFIYRWALYKEQVPMTLTALGAGAGFNLLYWLLYGRRHPPGSSDSITVVGMEE